MLARLGKAIKAEENEANKDAAATDNIDDESSNQNLSKGTNDAPECDSNDGLDIDMTDIVVIDEYDSTKNDGKHDGSSRKVILSKQTISSKMKFL